MKNACLFLILLKLNSFSQIFNPGFEIARDTIKSLPANWRANIRPQFNWFIDSTTYNSGSKSLTISNDLNLDSMVFSPFSQICSIEIYELKKIELTAFIKTKNVSQNAGLWCQLLDKDNKQIGFSSLETQQISINGNTDWTKYAVTLQVNEDVKKILLGGFLKGTGQVWYDDFRIEVPLVSTLKPTRKAKHFIDHALKITQNNSIVRDSINWVKTKKDIYSLAQGAQTTKDCYSALNYLISVLKKKGDNHSGFYPPDFNTKNETENMDGRISHSKYLGKSIGYIEVPGFMSVNQKLSVEFATHIQNQIKSLDSSNTIDKWIIDLRENSGGNMYPMITGLGPLLGESILGYFYDSNRKDEYAWKYEDGATIVRGKKICKVKNPYTIKNKQSKIIVLVGSETGSSGEMTTISFIGNKNTLLVGQPTAGYTTGNAGHKLSDGSVLNIAGAYCLDRNKKMYLNKIEPDFKVENYMSTEGDSTIEFAKQKLLE